LNFRQYLTLTIFKEKILITGLLDKKLTLPINLIINVMVSIVFPDLKINFLSFRVLLKGVMVKKAPNH
jgi:hypothetical protein